MGRDVCGSLTHQDRTGAVTSRRASITRLSHPIIMPIITPELRDGVRTCTREPVLNSFRRSEPELSNMSPPERVIADWLPVNILLSVDPDHDASL